MGEAPRRQFQAYPESRPWPVTRAAQSATKPAKASSPALKKRPDLEFLGAAPAIPGLSGARPGRSPAQPGTDAAADHRTARASWRREFRAHP
jgi:hypothetical protein